MNKFKFIFSHTKVGMAVWSTKDHRLKFINPAFAYIHGYEPDELLGTDVRHIFTPESMQCFSTCANNPSYNIVEDTFFETVHAKQDGSSIPLSVHVTTIKDTNGSAKHHIANVIDISQHSKIDATQKNISKNILSENNFLNSTLQNLPGFAFIFQLHPDGREEFLYASDKILDTYGIDAPTVLSDIKALRSLFHPDDIPSFKAAIEESAKNLQLFHAEFRINHPHKGEIWLETRSTPISQADGSTIWHGITMEISRRKHAELALIKTSAHLSCLVNTIPDLVWMKDKEGTYLACNHAFEKFFGATEHEIIGKTDYDFVDPTLADFFRKKDKEAIKKKDIITNEEVIVYKDTGVTGLLETRKVPLYSSDGQVHGVLGIAKDITEQHKLQEQLKQSEMRLKEAQKIAKIGSWELKFPELRLHVSDELYHLLKIVPSKREASFDHFLNIVHPDDRQNVEELYHSSLKNKTPYEAIHRIILNDGHIKYIHSRAKTFYDALGKPLHSIGTLQDITEQKQIEKKVEFLAHHDPLTGLPNRTLVMDRVEQAIAFAKRKQTQIALIFVDMDEFKTINDSLGHSMGDTLLKAVASRLQENLRETDTISRQGGDEFLIVIPDIKNIEDTLITANKLLSSFKQPFYLGEHTLSSSISIGIAMYPNDGDTFEMLLRNADTAMYKAKEAGGNDYCFFDEQMNNEITEHLHILNDLKNAIANNEFLLHYQPQVDVTSHKINGIEALLRWNHPEYGLVAPIKFIPIAESSGLIVSIGEWVIKEACRQAAQWCKQGINVTVAINISAVQFKRGNLEETIQKALLASGLAPQYLELELTESILIHDTDKVLKSVQRLKELGIKLSIDDFGTGYSSLSYLKRFAVDKLKIDRSFIKDICKDQEDAIIVKTIIQMAKSLNLKTVAEGVETKEVLEIIKSHGCDEVQGFYFAKPMCAEDFVHYFSQRESKI